VRVQIQESSVAAGEEDLRVQQERYALGASTLLDVLNSQTTLDQARRDLIQARLDARTAKAQIEALIGRDLQ
jgi:outer membrane protein